MSVDSSVRVGTAGWSIRTEHDPWFATGGSHLQRYAARFNAVEINSSFRQDHRPATYERWAEQTPADFRFSVKVPHAVTHREKLSGCEQLLDTFLAACTRLGPKLGAVLVQLPPTHAYHGEVAGRFFEGLRQRFAGGVVLEPRHASWFDAEPDAMLRELRIGRVAADPELHPGAGLPAGWLHTCYYRLHGKPRVYYSEYRAAELDALAVRLDAEADAGTDVWCIFDNTAHGHATINALGLSKRLRGR